MKKKGDPIDGVLLFDKPEGLSSNAAMQIVRRLANAQKAGHTGTLDPMATGLLPLCFGNATKYSADLLNAEKGKGTLYFAGQGIQQPWAMKRDMLSPRYTTRYSDLLRVG